MGRVSINSSRISLSAGFVVLILFGFVGEACAQGTDTARRTLPPEIMADRYVLLGEQLESKRDYANALRMMDKAIALKKQHDIELPDEFHFMYARIAFAADSIRIAYDAVVAYLVKAGRDGKYYKEALALSIEAEEELEVPEILPEETCAGKQRGSECWRELTSQPQCYVWDEYYFETRTVTWSGSCSHRVARGKGTITWFTPVYRGDGIRLEDSAETATGRLKRGKFHGQWTFNDEWGLVSEGTYQNGKKHGHWIRHHASNLRDRGEFVDGKREGTWLKMIDESCWSITYRQGDEVASRQTEASKCQGW